MLEVLDSEQNSRFIDHYVDMPVDLSEVLFIATANDVHTIPRPLLDRMELIEVSSYTENEKMHIAKEHLLDKQIEKNGLKPEQLTITDEAMHQIISGYTREAGVRNLERKIGEICRKAAREIYEGNCTAVHVEKEQLEQYLGKERFHVDRINEQDEIGIVRGLAWTSVGGDTLQIEVNVMPGKGEFKLTGQLGDVMKESAQAGISYIRSVGDTYDIPEDFFTKHDIHIHIPERCAERRTFCGYHHGDGNAVRHHKETGARGCGNDRRDHPARPCAADRWSERKAAGSKDRRHPYRMRSGPE